MYCIFSPQLSLGFFYTLFLLWKNGTFICNYITILFLLWGGGNPIICFLWKAQY